MNNQQNELVRTEEVIKKQLPNWRKPFSALWWQLSWNWFIHGQAIPQIDLYEFEIPDDSELARLINGDNLDPNKQIARPERVFLCPKNK